MQSLQHMNARNQFINCSSSMGLLWDALNRKIYWSLVVPMTLAGHYRSTFRGETSLKSNQNPDISPSLISNSEPLRKQCKPELKNPMAH